jgi:hypothetical protein
VQVGDTLGGVDKQVGAGRVWAEAPDLASACSVPGILVDEEVGPEEMVVVGLDFPCLDRLCELLP